MSPQDDPEERIRQLEQQSANYGAVELGSSQTSGAAPTPPLPPPVYGGPPAPPSPPYGGDPYQGNPYQPPFGTPYTPMPKKSGAPTGLIFGLIAFVVVAIFVGVGAAVWSFMSSNTPHVTIRPGNPGGSFEVPGGPTIDIPTMPSIPMMPGEESQEGRPGEPLSIAGIDKNQTVACNDAIATVSGVNNTVNLTGHCLSVTVSGVNNRVTIEATDKIGASGFDNQVIYLSGDPQIDATDSNTVQRG